MVLHQLGLGHRTGVFGRDDDVVLGLAVPAAVVELDEDILRLGQSEGLEIQGRDMIQPNADPVPILG